MASKGDINKYEIQPSYPSRWSLVSYDEILEKTKIDVKLKSKDINCVGLYPVVDQGAQLIAGYVDDEDSLYTGNLPVVIFGDHTKNIKYVDFKFAVGADGTKLLKPKKGISERFLYYNLLSLRLPDFGYSRHFSVFKTLDFPLPPLPEQERIVAKLNKLFAQHENVKKALDRIPQLLKTFRQQVLTQAVTGKLTEQWREGKELNAQSYFNTVISEKNKQIKNKKIKAEKQLSEIRIENILQDIPADWVIGKVGEITSFFNGDRGKNYPNRKEYVEEGVAFINTGHILPNGYLDITTMNYITQRKFESLSGGKIEKNDLVYCLRGATLGKTALVEQFQKGAIASSLVLIRPVENVSKRFLYYFFISSIGKKYIKEFDNGSAQPNLSAENVRNYIIGIPHFQEQQEIVRRVENLFAKADAIEKRYKILNKKIDKLPQTILYKAFKGELVPQLPTDGDAKDLLAEITALKKGVNGKKK